MTKARLRLPIADVDPFGVGLGLTFLKNLFMTARLGLVELTGKYGIKHSRVSSGSVLVELE